MCVTTCSWDEWMCFNRVPPGFHNTHAGTLSCASIVITITHVNVTATERVHSSSWSQFATSRNYGHPYISFVRFTNYSVFMKLLFVVRIRSIKMLRPSGIQLYYLLTYGAELFLRSCQVCSHSENSQQF
jgi:hypothetical protein